MRVSKATGLKSKRPRVDAASNSKRKVEEEKDEEVETFEAGISTASSSEGEADNDQLSMSSDESKIGGEKEDDDEVGRLCVDDFRDADEYESDEEATINRMGNVPLEWYEDMDHVGYDASGKKVMKSIDRSEITKLLEDADDPDSWRKIRDLKNQREVTLSATDLEIIRRLRQRLYPNASFDPYGPDSVVEFSQEPSPYPAWNSEAPKRRFLPSKHEQKAITRLVQAIRKGHIRPPPPPRPEVFDLWGSSLLTAEDVRTKGPPPVPAPRAALPTHAESYNPSPEYLFDEEERREWEESDPADRRLNFMPRSSDCLRRVPVYADGIRERFERCLDLYLCPRGIKMRTNVDPSSILPVLPKPQDLRPFPTKVATEYRMPTPNSRLECLCVDPTGTFLAGGTLGGELVIYNIASSLPFVTIGQAAPAGSENGITAVAFHPSLPIIAFAVEDDLYITALDLPNHRGTRLDNYNATKDEEEEEDDEDADVKRDQGLEKAEKLLRAKVLKVKSAAPWFALHADQPPDEVAEGEQEEGETEVEEERDKTHWREKMMRSKGGAVTCGWRIPHGSTIKHITWHSKGLYLAVVCPNATAPSQQCALHAIAKRRTIRPLRRATGGKLKTVLFHPKNPWLLAVHHQGCSLFDLQKSQRQEQKLTQAQKRTQKLSGLMKKLTGVDGATCASMHASGEHFIVGSLSHRVVWFDLELGTRPYKIYRYHKSSVLSVGFHPHRPLMFSASADGSVHIFHARVYDDLVTNPLIVPVKKLHLGQEGGATDLSKAALCASWHPSLPWLFTGCADGSLYLWT